MNNLELILNFMSNHPILTILIIWAVFSWTPVKITYNYNTEDKDE